MTKKILSLSKNFDFGEDSTTFLSFAQVSESANQLKAVGQQLFDMALLPRQIDHI